MNNVGIGARTSGGRSASAAAAAAAASAMMLTEGEAVEREGVEKEEALRPAAAAAEAMMGVEGAEVLGVRGLVEGGGGLIGVKTCSSPAQKIGERMEQHKKRMKYC